MSSSVKEDQELRENTSMEDSTAMTIKFLRARLLSERSVSKTAMQRAEELSKRVVELEEQLKFTSIKRRTAEKAMADVLAILENHGISAMPEGFDSNSGQDGVLRDFKTDPLMLKETSTENEAGKNEMEAYYSSEIESPPSTGRSLTWKCTKESQYSLEKKKQMDSIRRRTSFALNGSSARRAMKSCHRIRRREIRAVEEFQNDGPLKASFSRDASNSFDGETDALMDSNNLDGGKKAVDKPMLESESGRQKISTCYITLHERDKDMESALEHQAQLIGQYEEEEKAQREWEEKFRESNSCEQDSGDPGNRSDVTEDRDDIKPPEISDATGTLITNNQGPPQTPKCLSSLIDAKNGLLQDSSKSPESEIPIWVTNGDNDPEVSGLHYDTSVHICKQYMPMSSNIASPSSKVSSHAETSSQLFISPSSSSSLNLTVGQQETSTNLGSVLEALQQAKSSLQEKLNSSSVVVDRGTSNTHDTFKIPTGSHALLRLPTEDQHKANTIANHPDIGIGVPSIFSSFSHEVSGGRFSIRHYVDPRMALSNEVFFAAPSSTSTETRYRAPPQRSLSQPRLGTVPPSYNQTNHIEPYTNMVPPSVKDSYPFLPDFTFRFPLKEETVRTSSSSETGLAPVTHLRSYNEHYGS